ncbi:uncharacterized protein LOC34619573 [Cyclospora cayetanensis]|uniref:non-specific serine/threonine protein kinase n=1 Tax=Cyclospora cayetanensis TaxID=88456 RepID=A0A6P6RS21_9EIME|nr:uncharacterized protein LOC34619573 [Cyclospora cayetanensis]
MGNAMSGGFTQASPSGDLSQAPSQTQTSPLTDEQRVYMEDYPFLHAIGCISTSRISSSLLCVSVSDGLTFCKLFVNKNAAGTKGPPLDLRNFQTQKLLHKAVLTFDIHPNVCPDERLLLAERSALLLRRYLSGSVWERLHARPAPTPTQLLYICFQLLAGIVQLHSLGFTHCDIKTENMGLTSSLHAFLTDAAPWKDVDLRLRDMRAFSLLFESSKRSRCYLAPERFGEKDEAPRPLAEALIEKHSAEMFSVNCTLAEILLEGADVIDLLHLLELRDWLAAAAAEQQQQEQQQQEQQQQEQQQQEQQQHSSSSNSSSSSSNIARRAFSFATGNAAMNAAAPHASLFASLPGLSSCPTSPSPPAALLHLFEGISCRRMQALLLHGGILQLPHMRLSAQDTLRLWMQNVFPPCFANYFLCLFTVLLHPAYQQPDLRILLLKEHLPDLCLALLEQRPQQQQQQQQQEQQHLRASAAQARNDANEELLLQLLREAAGRETLEVDGCIAHQTVLNMAITMPQDCPVAGAMLHAWSAGGAAAADAAAASAAATVNLLTAQRDSRVLPAASTAASGGGGLATTEESLLVAEAAQEAAAAAALTSRLPHPVLSSLNARQYGRGLMSIWESSYNATVLGKRPAVDVLEELEERKLRLYDELFRQRGEDSGPSAAAVAEAGGTAVASEGGVSSWGGDCSTPLSPVYPQWQTVSPILGPPEVPTELFASEAASAAAVSVSLDLAIPVQLLPAGAATSEERAVEAREGGETPCAGCMRSGATILATEIIGLALQHTSSPRIRACGISLLRFLSRIATTEVLLESLLPFLTHHLGDPLPVVRAAAVKALAAALLQLNAALHHEAACSRLRLQRRLCAFCGSACGSQNPLPRGEEDAACSGFLRAGVPSRCSGKGVFSSQQRQQRQQQQQRQRLISRNEGVEKGAPQADAAALFCGYILPALHRLSTADPDPAVRVAVTETLPLMLLAVRACLHFQAVLRSRREQQGRQQLLQRLQGGSAAAPTEPPAAPLPASCRIATAAREGERRAPSAVLPRKSFSAGNATRLCAPASPGNAAGAASPPADSAKTSESNQKSFRQVAVAAGEAPGGFSTAAELPERRREKTGEAEAVAEAVAEAGAEAELAEAELATAEIAESEAAAGTAASPISCVSPGSPAGVRVACRREGLSEAAEQHLMEAVEQLHAAVLPTLQQQLTCRPLEQRLALLRSVPLLAAVLGPQKTHSFLLPYLIVQLNDTCAAVRAAVIRSLGSLGSFALPGSAESCIVPCCEQCLLDQQEEVIVAAVTALAQLAADDLLRPSSRGTYALLGRRVVPLLLFPSLLLRGVLLHLLAAIQKSWGPVQTYALLMPLLHPVLRRHSDDVLLVERVSAFLRPPLSRQLLLGLLHQQMRGRLSEQALALLFSTPALKAAETVQRRLRRSSTQKLLEPCDAECSSSDGSNSSSSCGSSSSDGSSAAGASVAPVHYGVSPVQRPRDRSSLQEERQVAKGGVHASTGSEAGSLRPPPVLELARFLWHIGKANRHALLLLLPTLLARRQAAAANAAAAASADEDGSLVTAVHYPIGSAVETLGFLDATLDTAAQLQASANGDTEKALRYMLPQGPPCRQVLSAMRLAPTPPNTSPLTRVSLWGLLSETLLPHVMQLVLRHQLLLLQRCLFPEEARATVVSTHSTPNNIKEGGGCKTTQSLEPPQLSLAHTLHGMCPAEVSSAAAKSATRAALAAASAIAGALGRYLWTYPPQPSLLQALLGLSTHHNKHSSSLSIQASCGPPVVSGAYLALLLAATTPAAAVAALTAEVPGSSGALAPLKQVLLRARRGPSHELPSSAWWLEAAAATAAAAAAAAAASGKRLPLSAPPLSPYRGSITSTGVPPPLQRDWRCVVLGLPRRPSLEVGRLQRLDEGLFSLYPYQQRLTDSVDAFPSAERRHSTLARRLSTGPSTPPPHPAAVAAAALGGSQATLLANGSGSAAAAGAASVRLSGKPAWRTVSTVVGGLTADSSGVQLLPVALGSTASSRMGRALPAGLQDWAATQQAIGTNLDRKGASIFSGNGIAGLPDLSCWKPKGLWLRSFNDFEALCCRGGGVLSLAATDDGRLLCAAPLALRGGEIRVWKAVSLLAATRPPIVGFWQLPSQLHLTAQCLIQNTKTLAVGTSDGACHLVRLDSGNSNCSSNCSSTAASSSSIPGAVLRLQTPRLFPAPLEAQPCVLLEILQRSQQGDKGVHALRPKESAAAARAAVSLSRLMHRAAAEGASAQRAIAGVAAARASTAAAAAGGNGIACLCHQDTALEQLLLYALRNGLFGGWDLRTASPCFAAHLPPWFGAPSAEAIGLDARCAVVGTTGGLLLHYDLRMQVPVSAWLLQPAAPIKHLLFVDPSVAAISVGSAKIAAGIGSPCLQPDDTPTCCLVVLLEQGAFPLLLLDLMDGSVVRGYNTSCFADAAIKAAAAEAGALGAAQGCAVPRLVPVPMEALRMPSAASHLLPQNAGLAGSLRRVADRAALHTPCCLWSPSPLRGPTGFVLTAGEDRCVHYWDLAEERAVFAANLGERQEQQQQRQQQQQQVGEPTGVAAAPISPPNTVFLDHDLVSSYCVLGPPNACGCRAREDSAFSLMASLTVEGTHVLQQVCSRSAQGKRFMQFVAAAAAGRGPGNLGALAEKDPPCTRARSSADSEAGGYSGSPSGGAGDSRRNGKGLVTIDGTSCRAPGGGCCCVSPSSRSTISSWAPAWIPEDASDAFIGFRGPSPMHRDAITGLAVIGQSDLFLATAGRDGIVKIWS